MQRNVELEAVSRQVPAVSPVLDERSRRRWAAAESVAIGYGGDALSYPRRRSGRAAGKSRKRDADRSHTTPGRGATPSRRRQPGLLAALEGLVDPLNVSAALDMQDSGEARVAQPSEFDDRGPLYQLGYRLNRPGRRGPPPGP